MPNNNQKHSNQETRKRSQTPNGGDTSSQNIHHPTEEDDDDNKEKRRRKQFKKMGKILAHIWNWDENFQEYDPRLHGKNEEGGGRKQGGGGMDFDPTLMVLNLTQVGEKVDSHAYRLGRHGWEDFAKDVGGVYNWHIQRNTSYATDAQKCLDRVKDVMGQIDESLAKMAAEHVPVATLSSTNLAKKRKVLAKGNDATTTSSNDYSPTGKMTLSSSPSSKKKKKTANQNSELAVREERALELLATFLEERGGDRQQAANFTARVTRVQSQANRYDTNFFNPAGRRFRSMLEVGRFLGLVKDGAGKNQQHRRRAGGKPTSREVEARKKNLRKELERLRKSFQRATKQLEDFVEKEATEEDVNHVSEQGQPSLQSSMITPLRCAAARIPDFEGFTNIPEHCVPDVLMTWNFLNTFERALNLSPISLDDFVDALVYTPPEGPNTGDDLQAPPVYLAEAHLALLNLVLSDKSSDDWWWSVLETDVLGTQDLDAKGDDEVQRNPVVKLDVIKLLDEPEDPLITTSWWQSLDSARKLQSRLLLKTAIQATLKMVDNRWVATYLRRCLSFLKTEGVLFTRRSIAWLVQTVKQARPDLWDAAVKADTLAEVRQKVIEETNKLMNELPDGTLVITEDNLLQNADEEEDEDSEDSDDEDDERSPNRLDTNPSRQIASSIPPKPLPTFVDLLLPPGKPNSNDEFVNAFTWPHVVGATAARIVHRRKRLWNEVDDALRDANQISPLTIPERRERENLAVGRTLTECVDTVDTAARVEKAIQLLCEGGSYISLSVVQRLCILRLLIEAAYDSYTVYEVVSNNYKQKLSAMKALENEQRRAKKEAKEKNAADDAAARDQLAAEIREKFLDEKREEIRKLNEKSKEFSDEVMESLTYEDIIDFDEDIKADYEALPGPESFTKAEVNAMVARLAEEAAFDTDALRVITMDELLQRDKVELEEMEGQLLGFGGEEALNDHSLDRETVRSIERLQRDIMRIKTQAERLPELREKALEQLRDAMTDGTIKVLRSAISIAKKAKLIGPDDETGGMWAVDILRDAALELEKAKQNKRVFDAQKDLLAKSNRCFIRCEPFGFDRFANRFWTFSADAGGHIWAEAEYTLKDDHDTTYSPPNGFSNLLQDKAFLAIGVQEMENDFEEEDEAQAFRRQEYHGTSFCASLVKRRWGCHVTEDSLRGVIKLLDGKIAKEGELKAKLKDALEVIVESSERHENTKPDNNYDEDQMETEAESSITLTSGDESVFREIKGSCTHADDTSPSAIAGIATAIGCRVRLRLDVDDSKDHPIAHFECGNVTGWKMGRERLKTVETDAMEENSSVVKHTPLWRVKTDRGKVVWCNGNDLIQGMSRYEKWKEGQNYFECDAAFLAYRNNLGRYCGRASEAAYASSPIFLARLMVKKEGDFYPKLKIRSYDNNWGGKSGSRALWINSMKDYAYDFATVQQGLLTLESAFFEMTGSFVDYGVPVDEVVDVQSILDNASQRVDVELETIEKTAPGLWNNPVSRAVYLHIVSQSSSTGFLALAMDLLFRNTTKYLRRHRLLNVRTDAAEGIMYETTTRRSTRRMNAWQQKQQDADYQDLFE